MATLHSVISGHSTRKAARSSTAYSETSPRMGPTMTGAQHLEDEGCLDILIRDALIASLNLSETPSAKVRGLWPTIHNASSKSAPVLEDLALRLVPQLAVVGRHFLTIAAAPSEWPWRQAKHCSESCGEAGACDTFVHAMLKVDHGLIRHPSAGRNG